jgi:DNA repair exonuclease SbcCD nuclease subunit
VARFIHAADIHLDSPLVGLSRYEGAPVDLLRTATRTAFSALVDTAISEAVDFVVIAGDLYDGDWRDYNTGLFFCKEMGRLQEAGIPVFVLYGNHDAKSEITKQLRLPRNVHEFSSKEPQTFRLDNLGIALHGQSFRTAVTLENLATGYPDAVPGWLNIGVLHTALDGHAAHDPYAPCVISELVARGYDYWALGHVHEYAVRRENPWIVFPGNLQGRHIREQGERGAVLVTANSNRITVERRLVDVLRWYHLYVDSRQATSLEDVVDLVGGQLEPVVRQVADGRALAVRITIRGRCKAHGQLFGLESQLRTDILAQANAIAGDALWIEKVCLETSPALSAEELMARSDALADLQDLLADAATQPQFLQELGTELKELVTRCPKELLSSVPALEAIRAERLNSLVEAVAPSLLAQLAGES